ncbi:aminotransferase class V-fold PLP-dependent enzyme [Nonomuraea sp. NPDC050328]|uniref:aminotransferase class V-fold PLP-dependent enzyme n=1 Tax=Nonomuraea sp. NPDC050328 TaxID=3364361 RepID=UPI00379B914F
MRIDVDKVRAETPACRTVVHLNNAGAALPPLPVTEALTAHLALEAGIGGYEAADRQAGAVEGFYDSVAALVGAGREEIAYVENATRAWDLAFYGLEFGPGARVVTTSSEYASNGIAFLQRGLEVEVLPDEPSGELSLAALEASLRRGGVGLVAINYMPTHNGLVNPAAEVGRLTREHGVPYLLDACQAVGQVPVDVAELGCDFLSATGRKFMRGPRGTGFLYVRREVLGWHRPPFLDLLSAEWTSPGGYEMRGDARRYETWERYVAGQIALGVAAEYARGLGMEAVWARVRELAAGLRERLAGIPGVQVLDRGAVRGAIVSFTVAGRDSGAVRLALREQGINVSATDIAHQRLDPFAVPSAVRASVHYYNTEEELDRLAAALGELASSAR